MPGQHRILLPGARLALGQDQSMHGFVCSESPPGTTTSRSGGSYTAGADGVPYLVLCNVCQIAFLGVRRVCWW